MGTAGAEGFGPALRGTDADDAGKDETIGDNYGGSGNNDVDDDYNISYKLINIGASTGKLEQWEDVTEIVVDGVCTTEGQSQHAYSVSNSIRKCHQI